MLQLLKACDLESSLFVCIANSKSTGLECSNRRKHTRSSAIAERASVDCYYAVQGHSMSVMLVPIESPYATSRYSHPALLHHFQLLLQIMVQFAFSTGWGRVPLFNTQVRRKPLKLTTTKFGLNRLETSLYRV